VENEEEFFLAFIFLDRSLP